MKNTKLFITFLAAFGISCMAFADDASSSSTFTLGNGEYDWGTVKENNNGNSDYASGGTLVETWGPGPIGGGVTNIRIVGGSTLTVDAIRLSDSSPLIAADTFEVDITGGKIIFDIRNLDMGSTFYSLIDFNTFVGDSLLLDADDYFVLQGDNTGFYNLEFVDGTLWLVQNGYIIVPIPEASTYAAVFGVLALAFAAYRRRR